MYNKIEIADFHAHILPCADHGSDSVETSLWQLSSAANHGVTRIIATPHFYPHRHTVEAFSKRRDEAFNALKDHIPNGIDIKLRINWCCQQQVLKMEFDIPFEISQRYDAVPGAFIKRECNGKEYPVQGAIVLSERNGKSVVIAGNFSACDVQCNGKVRLTLLRTPVYSHHDPLEIPGNHIYNVSDLGVNEFSFKL